MKKIICFILSLFMIVCAFSATYKYAGKVYTEEEFDAYYDSLSEQEQDKLEEDYGNGLVEVIPNEREKLEKEYSDIIKDMKMYETIIKMKRMYSEEITDWEKDFIKTYDYNAMTRRRIEIYEALKNIDNENK